MIHGLEGTSQSGYLKSMAQAGLERGMAMHRLHMRSCGGTIEFSPTFYHAGLTTDLIAVLRGFRAEGRRPVFVIGFSLGGNVTLKMAGELGDAAPDLVAGVCAVSTPIDLEASAKRINQPDNHFYQRRFLKRMCARALESGRYTPRDVEGIRSIIEIDDRITAPSFGFGGAHHYYSTQSAVNFLDAIRIPTLAIQAKDDTFIPFESFRHPAFQRNPNLTLWATEYGGHLGFIARRRPRFWLDIQVMEWLEGQLREWKEGGPTRESIGLER